MSPLPTRANTSRPVAFGYGLRVDEDYYRLAVSPEIPAGWAGSEAKPPGVDIQESPEDLDAEEESYVFSRVEFTGGEGLAYAHRKEQGEDAGKRFFDSLGFEAVREPGGVTKLAAARDLAEVRAASTVTATPYAQGIVGGQASVWVLGHAALGANGVTRIDTPNAAAPTLVGEDPQAGEAAAAVTSLAYGDGEVYAALGANGIHRRDTAGAWTHWNALNAKRIWFSKGRVVGTSANGRSLYEVATSGAAPATALVNLGGDAEFVAATDGGHAILVGATNGYVYGLALREGVLSLRNQTQFFNEKVTGLAGVAGVVLVATEGQGIAGQRVGRLYRTVLTGQYTLAETQLLREWNIDGTAANTQAVAPAFLAITRDAAYFVLKYQDSASALHWEAWKYDVAYGSLFRLSRQTRTGDGWLGTAVIGGRLFTLDSAGRVHRQSPTVWHAAPWVISPLADFFTKEDKSWAAFRLLARSLPSTVTAYYAISDGAILEEGATTSWTAIKSYTAADGAEQLLTGVKSRTLAIMLKAVTDGTAAWGLEGFAVRAYAATYDTIMKVPVNISDQLERRHRRRLVVPGLGDRFYDALKAKEGNGVEWELLPTGETYKGHLKQVETRLVTVPHRGSRTLIAICTFKGRRTAG